MSNSVKVRERKPKTFVDNQGREWRPVLDTPTTIKACRALDITVQQIINLTLNVGDVIDLSWYMCRGQAEERKMSWDDFMTTAVTLDKIPDVITAVQEVLIEAFPSMKDTVETLGASRAKNGPFENGK